MMKIALKVRSRLDVDIRARRTKHRPGIDPGRMPRRVVVIEYLMNEKRVRQNCYIHSCHKWQARKMLKQNLDPAPLQVNQ